MDRTIWNEETYTYHYGRDTIYIKISDELEKEGKKNVVVSVYCYINDGIPFLFVYQCNREYIYFQPYRSRFNSGDKRFQDILNLIPKEILFQRDIHLNGV